MFAMKCNIIINLEQLQCPPLFNIRPEQGIDLAALTQTTMCTCVILITTAYHYAAITNFHSQTTPMTPLFLLIVSKKMLRISVCGSVYRDSKQWSGIHRHPHYSRNTCLLSDCSHILRGSGSPISNVNMLLIQSENYLNRETKGGCTEHQNKYFSLPYFPVSPF